ncbi:MBL fold metallo-hydrolase [Rhodococcus sp. 3Y1]
MKEFIQGMTFVEPDEVIELADGDKITEAGMTFVVDHTRAHAGIGGVPHAGEHRAGPWLAFTGDTLFQGSIGRSDLPGGNHEQLLASIARKLLVLGDETVVLPGHGGNSSIGAERSSNPFLVGLSAQE